MELVSMPVKHLQQQVIWDFNLIAITETNNAKLAINHPSANLCRACIRQNWDSSLCYNSGWLIVDMHGIILKISIFSEKSKNVLNISTVMF